MMECGYTGSFTFIYLDEKKSPEILFNENCGQLEFRNPRQHVSYLSKDNTLKLRKILSKL